jgi:hypothetical protein
VGPLCDTLKPRIEQRSPATHMTSRYLRHGYCGTLLCSSHAQRCASCTMTFCPSCLSFHQAEHAKPASAERPSGEKRKSA